jgi:dephospho-CoA kinase
MILAKDYPSETDQHRKLRGAIWSKLNGWRRFVIAIDGVDGAGKSTLARYLAWQLGMPVIESDLLLVRDTGRLEHHLDGLRDLVDARLSIDRPMLVEGVRVLRTLKLLGLDADFLVWVEQREHEGSRRLQAELTEYATEFKPAERADFVFRREPE